MEMGAHAELLRLRGHYYRLYTQQFRHQMEEIFELSEEKLVIPAIAD
jgi:ATP-binding cassette subfamily B protein